MTNVRPFCYLLLLCCSCSSAAESDEAEAPTPESLAESICEGMVACLSSLVTVEECIDLQLGCRDLVDPEDWDDHMEACLDLDLGTCQEHGDNPNFVACVQAAPWPPECQGSRP